MQQTDITIPETQLEEADQEKLLLIMQCRTAQKALEESLLKSLPAEKKKLFQLFALMHSGQYEIPIAADEETVSFYKAALQKAHAALKPRSSRAARQLME